MFFLKRIVQELTKEIFIRKTKVAVKLDGVLDDEAWKHAERGGDFHQYFPYDTSSFEVKNTGDVCLR